MAKLPPFMAKKPGKTAPAAKLCPNCKNPSCKKMGKCLMKGK